MSYLDSSQSPPGDRVPALRPAERVQVRVKAGAVRTVVVRKPREQAFQLILDILGAGNIVVMLCDTIYGLIGVSPDTERRIRFVKGRQEGKPFINLIPDVSWLPRMTESGMPELLKNHWPGPLTLIFPARGGGTVGLRVPEDEVLRRLMLRLGKPLFSTSVNRGGRPPLNSIQRIVEEFSADVDLIVDSGDAGNRRPSTIIDLTKTPFEVVRRGAVDIGDAAKG